MKLGAKQFLNPEFEFTEYHTAAVAIVPVPYEGGVSYGTGTAQAPDAVIDASNHLELYDEMLDAEPYRMGIATVVSPEIFADAERTQASVHAIIKTLIDDEKFVVMLGGDHSLSSGCVKALREKHHQLSVIQLDAHSDLRDTFEDSPYSHACAMSRIRELTENTLQIGIRSMSVAEARRIEKEKLPVCTMAAYRNRKFDINAALDALSEPVYLTVDVDVFDWSVIRSTGTPEPGGLLWDEAVALLHQIFMRKDIVGIDVVELCGDPNDRNSAFAVAKLIYKMLGFKLEAEVNRGRLCWPDKPRRKLFTLKDH
jgi:N1-aminopropylagmatine ureohydrolase